MKESHSYTLFQDFAIFSSKYITERRNGVLFDETFINAHEDQMISLELSKTKHKEEHLHYSIDSQGGASLGESLERALRTTASDIYLSVKLDSGDL